MPRAVLHFQLNVRDFDKSVAFYKSLGFVQNMESLPGPDYKPGLEKLADKFGVDPSKMRLMMLRFRDDPYMHIQIDGWGERLVDNPVHGKIDALGVPRICFLVDNLDVEIALLKSLGIPLAFEPLLTTGLRWGYSKAVMFRDPDGMVLEFVEVESYTKQANAKSLNAGQ